MVECPYFTTNILPLTANIERDFTALDTFVIYTCLEGNCAINWEDQSLTLAKGDSILVPAQISNFGFSVKSGEGAKLLEVYLR